MASTDGSAAAAGTPGPAVAADALGPVDAVLLSHDQHPDNLDAPGRRLLAGVPVTFSTAAAAGRLGGTVTALAPWQQATLPRPSSSRDSCSCWPPVRPLSCPDGPAGRSVSVK